MQITFYVRDPYLHFVGHALRHSVTSKICHEDFYGIFYLIVYLESVSPKKLLNARALLSQPSSKLLAVIWS
jgi:hypothetical protein